MDREERQLLEEKYTGQRSAAFVADVARLHAGEPLAYVIGWVPFLGLTIDLGSRPLIPRPETEWWTEHLVSRIGTTSCRVLDVCAGSGAIGLAVLQHCPNTEVAFGERVPEHLRQIEKNVVLNKLNPERVCITESDLFDAFKGETFDFIVTNPPYVPMERSLDESVTKWEPSEALFAGIDGLACITRIAQEAPAYLRAEGELWCEVDSAHAPAARSLFTTPPALNTTLHNDQYGRPRLIVAYY